VYLPAHFTIADRDRAFDLIDNLRLGTLVVHTADGLDATPLPFLLQREVGQHGTLVAHLSRANRLWSRVDTSHEAVVIFQGPQGYVSPGWYPTKAETGRVVPTWNYVAVHAYGTLSVHDDRDWVEQQVRTLTEQHESAMPRPWSVADAPADYIESVLRGIVGLQFDITRLEAKAKLSQNRPADVAGVVAGLRTGGPTDSLLADTMQTMQIGESDD
jgi:transcriptional regulator